MESMGCPTITDLKVMVRANQIKNNPITLQDIEVMERPFQKNCSMCRNRLPLHVDIIHVNGAPFLTSIDCLEFGGVPNIL